jgi:hypothetical protein
MLVMMVYFLWLSAPQVFSAAPLVLAARNRKILNFFPQFGLPFLQVIVHANDVIHS